MKAILAADLGGTHSRFAHFRLDRDGNLEMLEAEWLSTKEAGSFPQLLKQLQAGDFSLPPERADIAVLAVAGPVQDGIYCDPPNISWDIDLTNREIRKLLGRAVLINDFVAQAYACRTPVGKAARRVLNGEPKAKGTLGVLGGGTGLGKAGLVQLQGGDYLALPSEGGHACFPFVSPKEFSFSEFYREKSGERQITGDLVVSGRGLRHLHLFLAGEDLEPREVAERFTPESETLSWFARFYGRACRDFALEILALGGIYIAGGVAAQNPEILSQANFRNEFLDSPTMGHLLAEIPVYLIDNQDSGLWGAAFHGRQILGKG